MWAQNRKWTSTVYCLHPGPANENPVIAYLAFMMFVLVGGATAPSVDLAAYVGTYTFAPNQTLEIVDGDDLFAVLDEAKYKLSPSAPDQFTTITGQTVVFVRDAGGKVTGYRQDGKFHPRVSSTVTPESAALARPRPPGEAYRYRPPAKLHDGIAVGDIARSDLGNATADAIVHGILDGTYKDVHSVLLYQHGKLVLEEYFYGYSAQRTHQLRSATKSVWVRLPGSPSTAAHSPGQAKSCCRAWTTPVMPILIRARQPSRWATFSP
jgi:hypothetical protein